MVLYIWGPLSSCFTVFITTNFFTSADIHCVIQRFVRTWYMYFIKTSYFLCWWKHINSSLVLLYSESWCNGGGYHPWPRVHPARLWRNLGRSHQPGGHRLRPRQNRTENAPRNSQYINSKQYSMCNTSFCVVCVSMFCMYFGGRVMNCCFADLRRADDALSRTRLSNGRSRLR